MPEKYKPVRKYNDLVLFGDDGYGIFDKSPTERALDLATSVGCPVARRLVKPVEEGGRGADEMASRYAEVISYFGVLNDSLHASKRDDLITALTAPRPRLAGEPLGEHDENWIPEELIDNVLVPTSGYILPRLLTEYISDEDKTEHIPNIDKFAKLQTALDIFEDLAPDAADDIDLIVKFAEGLAQTLPDNPDKQKLILKRLLSIGKLNEDNIFTDYRHILAETRKTPILGNLFYLSIRKPERG